MHERSEKIANLFVAAVLILVPFHAFLTVWAASTVGHYTLLRGWALAVLVVLSVDAGYWLYTDREIWRWLYRNKLMRAIATYTVLTLLLATAGWALGGVSLKAMVYGVVLNLRFLWFFVLVTLFARRSDWLKQHWQWLVIAPAVIVATFATVQYVVLPVDFLRHFGYGPGTIPAYATINSNQDYIRVASTLRGSNPLGAYMVVIMSVLVVLLMKARRQVKIAPLIGIILAATALLFSFSRSAWIGTVLAVITVGFIAARTRKARLFMSTAVIVAALCAGGAYVAVRHNSAVQNALLHTSDNSTVARSSNQQRLQAQKESVGLVVRHPFGMGVGSAGPASVYNTGHVGVISDNYFLQLAVEVGIVGVGLFVGILTILGKFLWRHRKNGLAAALFASLVGVTAVNLLSHAWTDDTLAYLWWGLGGIAIGSFTPRPKVQYAKNRFEKQQST